MTRKDPPARQQPAGPAAASRAPGVDRRRLLTLGGGIAALAVGGTAVALATSHGGGTPAAAGTNQAAPTDPDTGWDPGTLPTAVGQDSVTDAVNVLVAAQNKALATKDKAAFTAAYAPGPAATQAAIMFDNIQQFDFVTLQYQVIGQGGRVFDAGTGADVQMDIALVHQLRDVDGAALPEWYRWSLSRAAGAGPFTITAVNGSPSIGGSDKYVYYPAAWDSTSPITVIKRQNTLLVATSAADAATLQGVADLAAQCVATNRAGWKQGAGHAGVAPGALFLGTSDKSTFYTWYSGQANKYGSEAGLTIPMLTAASQDDPSTTVAIGGSRIVLDLTSQFFTAQSGEVGPEALIQHEDAHNMVFSIMTAAEFSIPTWVIEGFADFMATRTDPDPLRDYFRIPDIKQYDQGEGGLKWDGATLPDNADVYSIYPAQNSACYGLATLAYYYIFQKLAMPGVIAFLTANYSVPPSGGFNGHDSLDSAIAQVLGTDTGTFQQEWAAFVHQTIGA